MNRAGLIITLLMGALSVVLWWLVNRPGVEPAWPAQVDGFSFAPMRGDIRPGEPIVLTAAWSAHRAQAFDACRHLMEELKSKAPFWKKETTDDGETWQHIKDLEPMTEWPKRCSPWGLARATVSPSCCPT